MRDSRGRAATLRSIIAPSGGLIAAIALAGCVSGADTLADAGKSLDPAHAAVRSSASPSSDGAANGQTVSSGGNEAPQTAKSDSQTASKPVSALALAEPQGSTPALEAARTMIANTGERVGVPSPSPHGTADASAATGGAGQEPKAIGEALQTTGTVMMTAKDAAPDPIHTAAIQPAAAQAQKGEPTSPLARLFSSNQTGRAAPGISLLSPRNSQAASAAADDEASDEPDAAESDAHLQAASAVAGDDNALPGVHLHSIYEFGGSSNATGGVRPGEIQLASAAGAARLSPDFLVKQRDTVQTACLKPALLGLLRMVEYHFGKPVVITSGYRGPAHNAAVGGVRHSEHMKCEAADIQLDGVSKWDIARYVRSIPGRGGVGTYCHTDSVHVDIGEQRDWNWRCRRGH